MMDLGDLKWKLKPFWLVVKYRPFFKCPCCDGRGGDTDYYGEWSECYICYEYGKQLYSHDWDWFLGRLPLIRWISVKISIQWGLMPDAGLIQHFKCKLGFHHWETFTHENLSETYCIHCFEMKDEGVKP